MKKYNVLLIVVFALLIQGCIATTQTAGRNIHPEEISDIKDKAILFGMLSAEGGTDASLYIDQQGKAKTIELEALGLMRGAKQIDDNGKKGRLFSIAVEPGSFQLTRWTMYLLQGGKEKVYYGNSLEKPDTFSAKSGELIYLGSFNVKAKTGLNHFNLPVVEGATFETHPQLKRDHEFLLEKYPALAGKELTDYSSRIIKWNGQENKE